MLEILKRVRKENACRPSSYTATSSTSFRFIGKRLHRSFLAIRPADTTRFFRSPFKSLSTFASIRGKKRNHWLSLSLSLSLDEETSFRANDNVLPVNIDEITFESSESLSSDFFTWALAWSVFWALVDTRFGTTMTKMRKSRNDGRWQIVDRAIFVALSENER